MEQITLENYMSECKSDYAKKYPIFDIGKEWKQEEEWIDDWHYAKFEQPETDDIYCGITVDEKGNYNYTYLLWLSGRKKWFWFDGWAKKWRDITKGEFALAWMVVPRFFYRNDKGLRARYDALEQFVITK